MKQLFLILLISVITIAGRAQTAQVGSGETDGYRLVWQDLFDGAALDMDIWNIEVNGDGGGNNELQYYRSENVGVGNEPTTGNACLVLTAKKENYGGKTATSGRINSKGNMNFKYGKLEASIKLPDTANGLWPAFWMLGANIDTHTWPNCGEIDIMEMGNATGIANGTQDRYFNGACHWGYYVGSGYPNYGVSTTYSYSLQDAFHLFTLIWDSTVIRMYVDLDKYPSVNPYYQMTIDSEASDMAPGSYFHKPFHVLFNLAVGGNFPQIWDINKITALANGEASMYVNYVRLYQKVVDGGSYDGPAILSDIVSGRESQISPFFVNNQLIWSKKADKAALFDLSGHLVWEGKNVSEMDMSGYQAGIYVLRVENANAASGTYKVVKR